MSLKLFCIICLFTIMYPIESKSQDTPENAQKLFNLGFGLNLNTAKFYNSNFINSLKEQNLPTALDHASFGLNSNIYLSHLTSKTWAIAIIGVGAFYQKRTINDVTLNATAMSNDASVHIVVWKNPRQYFYPGLGLGWLTYKYHFVNNTKLPDSYAQSLQNFSRERTIQSGALIYLNFAANYDWAIDKTNQFLMGIRFTYHLGLNHKNLQLSDGYQLIESPILKASSFSIGVAITIQ